MLYRCRLCKYEEARGWLPPVTCGMLLFGQMAFVLALLMPVIRYLRGLAREAVGATTPGTAPDASWWALLVVPLAVILVVLAVMIGAILMNTFLELLEWLAFSCRRCPKCGRRRWSWGFTRGFGL